MNASEQNRGVFITLDGVDGVGKSTQIRLLCDALASRGYDPLPIRDPGSTQIGRRLREILLESELTLHRRTEAMLFMASRCEMIETVIRPALNAGRIVISDRFLLANVVYQSIGGDVDPQTLWQLGRLANANFEPDLTVLLDMPAATALKRLDRPADRMESRGLDYLEAVRLAFLRELPNASCRTAIVSADQSVEDVRREIADAVTAVLPLQ